MGQHHSESGRESIARELIERVLAEPRESSYLPFVAALGAELFANAGTVERCSELVELAGSRVGEEEYFADLRVQLDSLRGKVEDLRGLPEHAATHHRRALQGARALLGDPESDPTLQVKVLLNWVNHAFGISDNVGVVRELTAFLEESGELLDSIPTGRANLLNHRAVAFLELGGPENDERARLDFLAAREESRSDAGTRMASETWFAYLELQAGRIESARVALARAAEIAALDGSEGGESPSSDVLAMTACRARIAVLDDDDAQQALLHDRLQRMCRKHWDELKGRSSHESGSSLLGRHPIRLAMESLIELKLARSDSAHEALDVLLEAQAVQSLALALGARRLGADELGELEFVQSGGVLMVLPGLFTTFVFAVDAQGVVLERASPMGELMVLAREFTGLVQTRPRPGETLRAQRLERLGRLLAEELLPASIRRRMEGWHEVAVVGRDLLWNLPFEALHWRAGRTLGAELPLTHLPSPGVGLALQSRSELRVKAEDGMELALLADPVLGPRVEELYPDLETLDFTTGELADLCAPFDEGNFVVRRAEEARVEALPRARIWHFLTHGVYDSTRLRPAGLVVAPSAGDGLLWSEDLEGLTPAPLVVISSCGAGRGLMREGDAESSNLAGAFLVAGANAVVSSSTDLAVGPTLTFMGVLHEELRAGHSVA